MEVTGNKGVIYEFGNFVLDPRERILFAGGVPVHLRAKEFDTLLLLIEHNGRALTKEEMISAVWRDSYVEESNLAKQISRLRKLLNANGDSYIETIPKHGYRFRAEIQYKIPEPETSLVLERRTVQRLSVEFDDGGPDAATTRISLPAARRTYLSWRGIVLIVVVVMIAFTAFGLYWQRSVSTVTVDPHEPVRLTDNPLDDTGPRFLRDGRIMFTRLYPDNHAETWVMQADGSGQEPAKMPDGKRILDWSPDGQKIEYVKAGDETKVYVSNVDGSGERLLPFRGGLFSPDSKMISTHFRTKTNNFDIFIYTIETGEFKNITNMDSFEADPSFSPDGKTIVFASGRDGNAELYSISIDGTGLRRLTNNSVTDAHGAFSPDGTQIVFGSVRENENGDVYLMNADGSGDAIKLAGWDKSNETAGPGAWSSDGTKIVFVSDRNGKDDVYVVSAEVFRPKLVVSDPEANLGGASVSPDGSKLVYSAELADKSGEIRTIDLRSGSARVLRKTELGVTSPHWSPDGSWIVYQDRIDGNSEVCLMRADGTDLRNLTNEPAMDGSPRWSPDGRYITFATTRGDMPEVPQLYIMGSDGRDPRPITPRKGWEGEPVFTSDGSGVIFSCDRENSRGNLLDVCEINIDGTGERRLLAHKDHDTHPVMSPDGKRIAFTAHSDGNTEIYIMNRDGSGLLRLTRNVRDDLNPEWSPDGHKLYFSSDREGRFAIYAIDL